MPVVVPVEGSHSSPGIMSYEVLATGAMQRQQIAQLCSPATCMLARRLRCPGPINNKNAVFQAPVIENSRQMNDEAECTRIEP